MKFVLGHIVDVVLVVTYLLLKLNQQNMIICCMIWTPSILPLLELRLFMLLSHSKMLGLTTLA